MFAKAMGADAPSDADLLKRIAAQWLRYRKHPMVTSNLPQPLRELLDEVVRRTSTDQPPRSAKDTPTETPESRRK
jgi:hypothetical protein